MQYTRPTSQLEEEEGGNGELLRLPPGWRTTYHPRSIRHTFWNGRTGRGQDDIPGQDMPRGWTYDYHWQRDRIYFMHIQTKWWQWESPRGDLLPHTLLPGWEAVFDNNYFRRRPYFQHTRQNLSRADIPGEYMPNGWTYEYDWRSSKVYYVEMATEWWQWEKPTIAEREGHDPHRGDAHIGEASHPGPWYMQTYGTTCSGGKWQNSSASDSSAHRASVPPPPPPPPPPVRTGALPYACSTSSSYLHWGQHNLGQYGW